ncbi:PDR/VanB family oxidoreductase [Halomonas beimenensis]|uniref:Vanillate O-demethylase oxidoreductase n=1 Tax=Halomonas beimenensis TaxID=475662 RepID=A0A291P8C2_9GAMM|nr:PDR/VanB family oxidoreductase [Halomonas beimenensis]ATJ83117.1 vanillate O-demethylase oxidoreductase [Halomonas beimenensis]
MTDRLSLILTRRRRLAPAIVELTLEAEDGAPLPPAPAGAHLELELPDGLVRHYSLLDDGAEGRYRLGVLREADSRGGSAFLADQASEGLRLTASLPRDRFPLDETGRRQVLIGGGIGITPLVAMARRLCARGITPEVHYLVRREADAAFAEELAALLPEGALCLHVSARDGRAEVASLVGEVDADTRVHACGPEGLLAALEAAAAAWPAGCLRLERFRGTAPDAAPRDGHCEIVLERSGRTLTLAPEESLLEGLDRAGVAPPTLCGEGACGTCACGVIEGEVDHRDVLQSDAEKAANDTLYACVSRPAGARLVLDL